MASQGMPQSASCEVEHCNDSRPDGQLPNAGAHHKAKTARARVCKQIKKHINDAHCYYILHTMWHHIFVGGGIERRPY